jgi:hypothetical protein
MITPAKLSHFLQNGKRLEDKRRFLPYYELCYKR